MILLNGTEIDITGILCGILYMLVVYMLSIILNIRIQKGKYGITTGRFKLYFIAAFFGMSCNIVDFILRNIQITDSMWIAKTVFSIYVLCKIFYLKNSGNPKWYTGDEYEDEENPFLSTVGMSFCIIMAYTLPMCPAILFCGVITTVNSFSNIEKYRFIRVVPMIFINSIEVVIATILVKVSYELSFFWAIFVIALIGALFNIIVGSLNDIIVDAITGERYLQD